MNKDFNVLFNLSENTTVGIALREIMDYRFVEGEEIMLVAFSDDVNEEFGRCTFNPEEIPQEILDLTVYAYRIRYMHSAQYEGLKCIMYVKIPLRERISVFFSNVKEVLKDCLVSI